MRRGNFVDSDFLKFWGTFLLSAARGQEQLEQMSEWMKKGFDSFGEMAALFSRFYGVAPVDQPDTDADESNQWEAAIAGFEESFTSYARQWGWVPEKEHQALIKENKKLRQHIDEKDKVIEQLRQLMDEKGLSHLDVFQRLQSLVEEQNQQFQRLMQTVHKAANNDAADTEP
jgi:hypothetical protein